VKLEERCETIERKRNEEQLRQDRLDWAVEGLQCRP